MLASNIRPVVIFNKKDISEDIEQAISSISYVDNSRNAIDDLTLDIENLDHRWLDTWYPDENAELLVGIYDTSDNSFLSFGYFYIDEPTFTDFKVNLKCLALPLMKNIRNQKNTVAWENLNLSKLINHIANKHEMSSQLFAYDFYFDRLDQENETDLHFLNRVAESVGLNMKVNNDSIIIFDDQELKENDTIETFSINDYRLRNFTLKKKNKEVYDKVELSYYDPQKKQVIKEIITKKELEERNSKKTTKTEKKKIKKTKKKVRSKKKSVQLYEL